MPESHGTVDPRRADARAPATSTFAALYVVPPIAVLGRPGKPGSD